MGRSSGLPAMEPGALGVEGTQKGSFLDSLKASLSNVNDLQKSSDHAVQQFASGQGGNLHDVMIAMEKAEVAIRTVASVRNKVVEAYQEILRMQV